MAHFAEINNSNIVTRVVVIGNSDCLDGDGNESEAVGVAFCRSLYGNSTNWVQTSYNNRIRKNYAGIGYTWDSGRNAFIPPKPYASWSLNETTCDWAPPTPGPTDGMYYWDEGNTRWVKVQ
jgi:hypothetical protein